ncbi:lysine-specific demethylase JMJ16 isoform A [Micractinium conductrix]|nr:lysine-specific demethylase JMJ16 isoform C [Micractinium conductrix]PSC72306.1 lysine-specific demethylase JMJ16 isoform A [Micractinium conductrix]|eukprot:PSC72304.1 lysine-specific demethylase JMJ16 isoform C [Micractinium conductrix]
MAGMARGLRTTARTGVPRRGQPRRIGGDLVQMGMLRRANDSVSAAARDTEEARALLGPGLPRVDEGVLRAACTGLFLNVLANGGVMLDVVQAAAVRSSMNQVEGLLAQQLALALG